MNFSLQDISASDLDQFWKDFSGEKSFLQESRYGDFRTRVGEKIFRRGLFFGGQIVGAAQIQKVSARRGTFLHVPHGPLIDAKHRTPGLRFFLEQYKTLGKQQGCDFVRVSPLLDPSSAAAFASSGFRPGAIHLINPEKTWVKDLSSSEEALLQSMRKSTRYEVRRIEKCGIDVRQGNQKEDLDIFWDLHQQTVARQGFVPFPRKNTEIQMGIYGDDLQIFSVSIDQKFYSSSIILFDKKAAYYHQGASIYSKLPVSHATIWAAMTEAKRRGCKEFNFWGVCDEEDKAHPWYGLSKFKRGFGGEERDFLHVQDAGLSGKYPLVRVLERWQRWRRGY